MADRIEGLKAKQAKKSVRLVVEFHEYCSCAFVSNLPNIDSDWPVTKYSVKHGRHTVSCTAPHCATRCTALRESRRTRAWFRSCLLSCTLLELFVNQSSYWRTFRGLLWNQSRTVLATTCYQHPNVSSMSNGKHNHQRVVFFLKTVDLNNNIPTYLCLVGTSSKAT